MNNKNTYKTGLGICSKPIRILVIFASLLLSTGYSSLALSSAAMDQKYADLMAEPTNIELLYGYAQEAIRQGEYESAVAVLEGLLVIARNQPQILLDLAALYKRLGALTIAESYVARAQALAEDDAELQSLAEFLTGSIQKDNKKHRFIGFVEGGLRYQTNPLASPEAFEIFGRGGSLLPNLQEEESDTNAYFRSRAEHRYRMNEETSWVSDGTLYSTWYDEFDRLDYIFLEGTTGPQFKPNAGAAREIAIRPHVLGRGTELDSRSYETTFGAGVDAGYVSSPTTVWRFKYQYRDRDFDDLGRNFDTSLRSGVENRYDLRYRREIVVGQILSARLLVRNINSEASFLSVDQYDAVVNYTFWLNNKLFKTRRQANVSPYVLGRWKYYDQPNPVVLPGVKREDTEWRLGLLGKVPMSKAWSLTFKLETAQIDSNIPNNEYENNLAQLGVRADF